MEPMCSSETSQSRRITLKYITEVRILHEEASCLAGTENGHVHEQKTKGKEHAPKRAVLCKVKKR
jgi:hypothetical protein